MDSFIRKQYLQGTAVIDQHKGTKSELGGFLATIPLDTIIVPTLSAIAMPSGIILHDTYETIIDTLIGHLKGQQLDGIFLALHGSMCVQGIEDPEGDLLRRLRQMFPQAVIGCTLDHHANVTKEMVEYSDFLVGYRTHPHVDHYEVGCAAAALMVRPDIKKLEKAFVKLPFVTPAENRSEPIEKLKTYAELLFQNPDIVGASFFVGYPWADVSIMGCSVYVLQKKAILGTSMPSTRFAEEFASFFWSLRDDFHFALEKVDSIPKLLKQKGKQKIEGPLVLDELSDCTFGGSSGDAVATAWYLANQHIAKSIVIGIVDAETVERAFTVGAGNTEHFTIGGKICRKDNPSIVGKATVASLHKDVRPQSPMLMESGMLFKRVAIIDFRGVLLAVIEYPGQIGGPAFLEAVGLRVEDFDCIVVKEGMNPFVTYREVASSIVMVESPGFNPQVLSPDLYTRLIEPVYPIFPMEADSYIPRRCI